LGASGAKTSHLTGKLGDAHDVYRYGIRFDEQWQGCYGGNISPNSGNERGTFD